LVVQAALFAGFLSSFLIELVRRLEPDPMDIIQDVLIYQTQMMRNSSLGPYVAPDFTPPGHIVVVNALFYASLCIMILAAFIAMLIKSWVREFDRGLRAMSIPEQRAKTREFRYLGMERWKLPEMVGILPSLIQISLFLFAIGLVLFLFHISTPSFGVTTTTFGVGFLYYSITTSISVFVTSSPFHSPLSRTLGKMYRHVHTYFCPSINDFVSETMDITSSTALDRVRRHIQIILQKSRPYLEKDFVEPIAAATMDEVQLSTAASALQRLYESAPNSQQSEPLQWAVWQVAGSPALRMPPSFNLPSWIDDRVKDKEYFSHLPPTMVVALVAVALRTRRKLNSWNSSTLRAALVRMENSRVPMAHLVYAVFDRVLYSSQLYPGFNTSMIHMESKHITTIIRRKGLQEDESLWLLYTLSELCSDGCLWREKLCFINRICLAILSDHTLKLEYAKPPNAVLLEAVVALSAISISPSITYRLNILTNSRQHPWLLQTLRNLDLISKMLDDTPARRQRQTVSLLFLVTYALTQRDSGQLAAQYLAIITAKSDFPLHTSALTAIAPALGVDGLCTIGRSLVAPRVPDSISLSTDSWVLSKFHYPEIFENYDRQLGSRHTPDHNFLAILLMLSEHLYGWAVFGPKPDLKNPWLRLAAQLDVPDGSDTVIGSFQYHRVHNMIAALSLLRYTDGTVTQ
jgi:hypothetical protein